MATVNVSTVAELTAAIADAAVARVVLAAGRYAFTSANKMPSCGHRWPWNAATADNFALCINRSITIEAAVAGTAVLDAQGTNAVTRRVALIMSQNASDVVTLIGLNMTGGNSYSRQHGAHSGGCLVIGWVRATLIQCAVYGNAAHNGGHGIDRHGTGDTTFVRCDFHSNGILNLGSGGAITIARDTVDSLITIEGCAFHHNSAGSGGAIEYSDTIVRSSLILRSNTFWNNRARFDGCAITVRGAALDGTSYATAIRTERRPAGGRC